LYKESWLSKDRPRVHSMISWQKKPKHQVLLGSTDPY
jgi:hypothetical protein